MTGRDAFTRWAPAGARWTEWVRPVPFTAIGSGCTPNFAASFTPPTPFYIAKGQKNTAIIIDAPGADGVKEGIALAKLGFRPIPLYNGTNPQTGAMALVDNYALQNALVWGALELEDIPLPPDAPPAFLLDSNRMHQYKMSISVFDNSWDLYRQDIPPAEYFLRNGIDTIMVRGEKIQRDLCKILYPFQKKGISILFTSRYAPPKKVVIKKPRDKNS